MGNKFSCCWRSSCSKDDFEKNRELKRGSEHRRSEYPISSPAGIRGSLNIADPPFHQNADVEKKNLEHEIAVEIKMKEGAEKLLKAVEKKKHLKSVKVFLAESNTRLEALYRRLQDLNAQCDVEEALLEALHPNINIEAVSLSEEEEHILHTSPIAWELPVSEYDHECDKEDLRLVVNSELELVPATTARGFPISMSDIILEFGEYPAHSDRPETSVSARSQKELVQGSEQVEKATSEPAVSDLVNIVLPADEKPTDPEEIIKPMNLQDFRCCAFLGKGSFGKVLLAEHRQTKKMFAIKAMQKARIIYLSDIQSLMYERNVYQVASEGHHPFLVNLLATFHSRDHACFVMEYAAGGDLSTNLMNASGVFPESRARFYASCVILGLEHLHKNKIIHRDIKLNNIVLDQEGFAKIADFGLSKKGIGFGDRTGGFCGTLDYMAPEIVKHKTYTRAVDWWSLGVLMYIMILGRYPIEGDERKELEKNILRKKIKYPRTTSPSTKSILKALLNRDCKQRLGGSEKGAEDIKQHLFFEGINWIELLARNVKPPFVPVIDGPEDTRNFDISCTSEAPVLTPPGKPSLTDRQQEAFKNFDWLLHWED
uniref:Uncharacterized protein n=1 Tax=Leptobrachium leishanense TaxID=445787 RepID=A0A8C5MR97_9ANUR